MSEKPEHYQNTWRRTLTQDDIENGYVTLKLDPYRICDILQIGGGAREQITTR